MLIWKKIVVSLAILLLDFFLGLTLMIAMMDYDDSYNESKGEYWSWESMDTFQKTIYVGMNLWWIVNLIAVLYFIYKFIKKVRTRYNTSY